MAEASLNIHQRIQATEADGQKQGVCRHQSSLQHHFKTKRPLRRRQDVLAAPSRASQPLTGNYLGSGNSFLKKGVLKASAS